MAQKLIDRLLGEKKLVQANLIHSIQVQIGLPEKAYPAHLHTVVVVEKRKRWPKEYESVKIDIEVPEGIPVSDDQKYHGGTTRNMNPFEVVGIVVNEILAKRKELGWEPPAPKVVAATPRPSSRTTAGSSRRPRTSKTDSKSSSKRSGNG
jgi:hypothetical protein